MKINYQHFVMRNIPRFPKEGGAIIRGGAIFRGNTVELYKILENGKRYWKSLEY